jgi:hypothetical protein
MTEYDAVIPEKLVAKMACRLASERLLRCVRNVIAEAMLTAMARSFDGCEDNL